MQPNVRHEEVIAIADIIPFRIGSRDPAATFEMSSLILLISIPCTINKQSCNKLVTSPLVDLFMNDCLMAPERSGLSLLLPVTAPMNLVQKEFIRRESLCAFNPAAT
eukprot:GHVR01024241.1.p2 GENE.GHVR01024241.1~~GHVR01024241.1.p2  ORF type:complete len:107 (-),score=5.79 GHVR01024241.1:888-1208(-)